MAKIMENWLIYPSKSHGVMIEYRDLSGKLVLALNYKPEQARELASQILNATEERRNPRQRIEAGSRKQRHS